MTEQTHAEKMTEALSQIGEAMEAVVAATAGHKARLEAAGFSPTAAEQGAMQYHAVVMTMMARPSAQQTQ